MSNIIPVSVALSIHTFTQPVAFGIFCIVIITSLILLYRFIEAVAVTVSLLITSGFVYTMKLLFAIPRPHNALVDLTDYAFPSGHASLSMFVATVLSLLMQTSKTFSTRVRLFVQIFLFLAAFYISFSRLTLQVHTLFQIFVGIILGVSVPLVTFYIIGKYYRKSFFKRR